MKKKLARIELSLAEHTWEHVMEISAYKSSISVYDRGTPINPFYAIGWISYWEGQESFTYDMYDIEYLFDAIAAANMDSLYNNEVENVIVWLDPKYRDYDKLKKLVENWEYAPNGRE